MVLKSRAEQAADLLKSLSRDLPPGERLGTKDEVRARVGVGVGTFHEALRLAQARGLIEVRPGRSGGVFTSESSDIGLLANILWELDPGAELVSQAFRLRQVIDPLLIRDAAAHAGPQDIAELRGRLETLRAARPGLESSRALWRLHEAIADISPHTLISSIYKGLLETIEKHTVAVSGTTIEELHELALEQHVRLVEAIASGDMDSLEAVIGEHGATMPHIG